MPKNPNKIKMPAKSTLKARISTINNSFAMSITPFIKTTDQAKIDQHYADLKVLKDRCAYCLRPAKSVDHLFPLVQNGEPSGYISDIDNLVPCCKDCNSKKGNQLFKDWYDKEETKEYLRHECDLTDDQIAERRKIIVDFIEQHSKHYDLKSYLTDAEWDKFLNLKEKINEELKEADAYCRQLQEKITEKILCGKTNRKP